MLDDKSSPSLKAAVPRFRLLLESLSTLFAAWLSSTSRDNRKCYEGSCCIRDTLRSFTLIMTPSTSTRPPCSLCIFNFLVIFLVFQLRFIFLRAAVQHVWYGSNSRVLWIFDAALFRLLPFSWNCFVFRFPKVYSLHLRQFEDGLMWKLLRWAFKEVLHNLLLHHMKLKNGTEVLACNLFRFYDNFLVKSLRKSDLDFSFRIAHLS